MADVKGHANEIEVTLTALTYGGEAMGRLPDGRAVFVPFALPGETALIRIREEKRGFARADLLEILQASPDRIEPRCPCYTRCGGCYYEHIPYELQTRYKTEILKDQLQRIGGLENPPVEAMVPSPLEWGYRNNVQFHVDPQGRLGFQVQGSHEVVPVEACLLPDETISAIWPQIQLDPDSGVERVTFRSGSNEEGMVVLESASPETPELTVEELPVSVVHLSPEGPLVLAGSPDLTLEVLGRPFLVSAESFFQVNLPVAEVMVRWALERLPLTLETTLLELYSGVGLFSAFLAPRVRRLVAVESSRSACADFEVNLEEFDNVELYEALVEAALPGIPVKPDVILADPPRSGLGRKVVEEILRMQPAAIAYISCDPSTLARDLRGLVEGGYRLERVTPFDMFPQTYHIETAVWMSRIDE